jgi:hypothetical protein
MDFLIDLLSIKILYLINYQLVNLLIEIFNRYNNKVHFYLSTNLNYYM